MNPPIGFNNIPAKYKNDIAKKSNTWQNYNAAYATPPSENTTASTDSTGTASNAQSMPHIWAPQGKEGDMYKTRSGVGNSDTAWDYVNNGGGNEVADIYERFDSATASDKRAGTDLSYKQVTKGAYQVQRANGNVPVMNTAIAYLKNNNQQTTATIKGSSADIAHNFFAGADNISSVYADGLTSDNGNSLNAQTIDDEAFKKGRMVASSNHPGATKIPNIFKATVKHDGILSPEEQNIAAESYVTEAHVTAAEQRINSTQNTNRSFNEMQAGQTVASTVDDDGSADKAYQQFMQKADIDGNGLDEQELANGFEAISEEKQIKNKQGQMESYRFFSKDKLKNYLNPNQANPLVSN